jgi:hypothetical protein
MRSIAQKAKFVCVLLTVILTGSLFSQVVYRALVGNFELPRALNFQTKP